MSAVLGAIGRLEDVSAVTSLASTRIYNGILPQSPTLPTIRVQRISEDEPMHLRGSSGIYRTRVQIDSIAGAGNPIGSAHALDAAVHGNGSGSSLIGWTGTVDNVRVLAVLPAGVREDYDAEELRQYRVMRDAFIWWAQ
jgi:hypothetical protein